MADWNLRQMIGAPPTQKRHLESFEFTPLGEAVAAFRGVNNSPHRVASINDALGVPAIQRAVSLISNTTGMLSVRGFRNGAEMTEPPRIIQRPDPFSTPREFYRDTAYYQATRGEFVWWIAARDFDGLAASLIVVPLHELTIEPNPRNRAFPIYKWGKVESFRYSPATPSGDFVHGTYLKEPGQYRGKGPLQLGGVAVSVSVEAQQWAANFFAGDSSTTELHSLLDINGEEAEALLEQWMEKERANLPRVTTPSLEWKDHHIDPAAAQMTESRNHQDGEAARMFGIPGSLLEYNASGSSLTYQNVEGEYTKFVRTCLRPNYLEPIEQAMTDLLTRSTVARFNADELLKADIKTRFEVYQIAIDSGVYTPEDARRFEGMTPGDVEIAPVPFAFPAAVPARIPER